VHEEWTDKLSEYLDGELPDDERRAVDTHLRTCAECSAVLADLKRVVARAQAVHTGVPRPPAVDLWDGIAARIEDSRSAKALAERIAPFTPRVSRRVTFTLPQLAAAAVLIAAVSGGLVWIVSRAASDAARQELAQNAPIASAPTTPPATQDMPADSTSMEPRIMTVAMADPQYDAAVLDLEKALKQGRGKLDASTIAIVEHNLQIIDQAIDQAREALAGDPANSYLSSHLVEARRRKLDLLRRAAAISETD
jgi:anti-sigma factor RsiW